MLIPLLLVLAQVGGSASGSSPLERLRTKTAVDPIADGASVRLAGQYRNPSRELQQSWGGGTLSGEDLYLFPDGTYLYCEWGDVDPGTISDKGTWTFADGLLKLKSDPDVTWRARWSSAQREYAVVRRASRKKEILLVGLARSLPFFEQEAGTEPKSSLLVSAMARQRTLDQIRAAKVKAKLMREEWRPESFRPTGR